MLVECDVALPKPTKHWLDPALTNVDLNRAGTVRECRDASFVDVVYGRRRRAASIDQHRQHFVRVVGEDELAGLDREITGRLLEGVCEPGAALVFSRPESAT